MFGIQVCHHYLVPLLSQIPLDSSLFKRETSYSSMAPPEDRTEEGGDGVKENIDPEELERNRTLTQTKTPAQLAEINSITEFPVPDKIKNLLSSSSAAKDQETKPAESKKRR